MKEDIIVLAIIVVVVIVVLMLAKKQTANQNAVQTTQSTHSITGLDGLLSSANPAVLNALI